MNNLHQQSYFNPSLEPMAENDNLNAPSPEDADYWRLRRMIQHEKRNAFWSGAAITGLSLFILFLLVMGTTSSGITFMTCQEFGETFTCRFGGM